MTSGVKMINVAAAKEVTEEDSFLQFTKNEMAQNNKVKEYAKAHYNIVVPEAPGYEPRTEEVKNDVNCQRLKQRVNQQPIFYQSPQPAGLGSLGTETHSVWAYAAVAVLLLALVYQFMKCMASAVDEEERELLHAERGAPSAKEFER